MGLFPGLRHRLDRSVRTSWQNSARSDGRDPGLLLAWELTADGGYCIGSAGLLSTGDGTTWQHIGWHRIERGGYDRDTSTLRWQLYDAGHGAGSGSVALTDPGRLPEVFRDRVAASIVVEQFFPLDGARRIKDVVPGVIVNGRRDLSRPDAPIEWRASLPRGIGWELPGIGELADTSIIRLRSEYDPES